MKQRYGLTLIEVLTVMGIVMLLAALLFPVYSMAKGAALRVDRTSRLKQLAAALEMYKTDYSGRVVIAGSHGKAWPDFFIPYTKGREVMNNPAYHPPRIRVPMTLGTGFAISTCVTGQSFTERPNPVTFFERAPLVYGNTFYSSAYTNWSDLYENQYIHPNAEPLGGKYLADHDRGGSLYAKWDGSVEWVSYASTTEFDFGNCFVPKGTPSLIASMYRYK